MLDLIAMIYYCVGCGEPSDNFLWRYQRCWKCAIDDAYEKFIVRKGDHENSGAKETE